LTFFDDKRTKYRQKTVEYLKTDVKYSIYKEDIEYFDETDVYFY
jgi:hypothetical protein